jgi:hypothetical protein
MDLPDHFTEITEPGTAGNLERLPPSGIQPVPAAVAGHDTASAVVAVRCARGRYIGAAHLVLPVERQPWIVGDGSQFHNEAALPGSACCET